MEKQEESELPSVPPYFKSWKSIYFIVLANLALMIFLLFIFSISYS